MKKIFLSLMIVSSMLLLTACGNSGNQYDNSVTPKLGDTVVMNGFEVTLVSYTIGKAIEAREEYQDLIYLDIKIKNTGSKAAKLNDSKYTIYSPNNTKIKSISSSKYTSSVNNLTNMRPIMKVFIDVDDADFDRSFSYLGALSMKVASPKEEYVNDAEQDNELTLKKGVVCRVGDQFVARKLKFIDNLYDAKISDELASHYGLQEDDIIEYLLGEYN